jgi:hypothetical protein
MQATHTLKSLWAAESIFRGNLDRAPFLLEHSLYDHPLFELPRLILTMSSMMRAKSESKTDGIAVHQSNTRWKR